MESGGSLLRSCFDSGNGDCRPGMKQLRLTSPEPMLYKLQLNGSSRLQFFFNFTVVATDVRSDLDS
jgi:hypothetical protein